MKQKGHGALFTYVHNPLARKDRMKRSVVRTRSRYDRQGHKLKRSTLKIKEGNTPIVNIIPSINPQVYISIMITIFLLNKIRFLFILTKGMIIKGPHGLKIIKTFRKNQQKFDQTNYEQTHLLTLSSEITSNIHFAIATS